jgi:hypothetical protein
MTTFSASVLFIKTTLRIGVPSQRVKPFRSWNLIRRDIRFEIAFLWSTVSMTTPIEP